MGGGLWFVVDVGEAVAGQRDIGHGGAAALRCKHFGARGKNRTGWDGRARKDVIRRDGAGASAAAEELTL